MQMSGAKQFWLWLIATALMLLVLSHYSVGAEGGALCFREALGFLDNEGACQAAARHLLQVNPISPVVISLWLDNVFVILYTGVFVLGYAVIARRKFGSAISWRQSSVVGVLGTCAVAGAIADYSENFLLLSALNSTFQSEVVTNIALASCWKFRLFALNILCLTGFPFLAKYVR